jgi:S1-C subfamily serine protease
MKTLKAPAILLPLLLLSAVLPALGSDINACKYLLVSDFTSDPFLIAQELRVEARSNGFVVISSADDVSGEEKLKACFMTGSWSRTANGGSVSLRVLDADNQPITEVAASGTNWWGAGHTVHGVVLKIYKQLDYTGFNDAVYQRRIEREYPKRPTLTVSEEEIKKSETKAEIEGIWTDTENRYRLGIVPAGKESGADYLVVVLHSDSLLWQTGEIKAEIRTTATPEIFTCTYFMQNKKPYGTTVSLEHGSMLRGSISMPNGHFDLALMRVWPTVKAESEKVAEHAGKSGTGFLLTRTGLIATNWHVVSDSKRIGITFPGQKESAEAEIVVRDAVNDLAILRIKDSAKLPNTCSELPFQVVPAKGITLGEHVSTIGYPLTPLLGTDPKFSEGVIASKSGIQDDPRWFQISAAIQPGSSGSPLFEENGNIIGIVVASLDAAKAFQMTNAIPQNVNWAIKSDYLLNLIGMIPNETLPSRKAAFSPEKAAACVTTISAW